jgi:serine/threonine-protein kinase HipA
LIKFPNSQDGVDAGALEYVYARMAQAAGIEMPEVHVFPAAHGPGYFGVKRFDRNGDLRKHVHTASGLLHSDHRLPALDYQDLLKLTEVLTKDRRDVAAMFRLAVFNVLARNRDDHAKNFAYMMAETGEWRVAPAYDLTYSAGPGGWQSTTVMGEGRRPGIEHLMALAKQGGLKPKQAMAIIDQVRDALTGFRPLAKSVGIKSATLSEMAGRLGV